ncbi:MAG TPA: carbohydrate kinase family protein [archaeon]|nr:carbohydrate kinase family protein [archaeon]
MDHKGSLKTAFDVSCAGHLCLDITPTLPETGKTAIEDILRPGTLLQVGPAQVSTGGAVSNTGIGLKIMGQSVAFMALVGQDTFGQIAGSILERHGSSAGIARTDQASTSYSIVIAPPGIDRLFLHDPGANQLFSAGHIDYEIVGQSRLFHLGYPTIMRGLYRNNGEELVEIFRRAKGLGVTTSLDLCMVDPHSEAGRVDWRTIFSELLPYVDLLVPSIEESFLCMYPQQYLGLREKVRGELIDHIESDIFRRLGEEFLRLGCAICMLKAGHQGIYLRTGSADRLARLGHAAVDNVQLWANRELWCPAFEVEKIASATGSGDSCIAGFLSGLLHGLPLERSLKMAVLAGYLNLQAVDSVSGLKSFAECVKLLESGGLRVLPIGRDLGDKWNFDKEAVLYWRKG